jgi:hypothetical protein
VGYSGWTHLDVLEIVRETENAFELRFHDDTSVWVPKSMVADAEDYSGGDCNVSLSVLDEFAEKRGLDKYAARV